MRPPEYVIPAHDSDAHRMLQLLDAGLELRWNTRLNRFEVWNRTGFVMGSPVGGGGAPGEWLLRQLRRRDPRHNSDLDDVVKQTTADIDAENEATRAASQAAIDKHTEEVTHEYADAMRREFIDEKGWVTKPFGWEGKSGT